MMDMDQGSECFEDVRADDAWSGDEQVHEVTKAKTAPSFHFRCRHLPTPFDTRLPPPLFVVDQEKTDILGRSRRFKLSGFPSTVDPISRCSATPKQTACMSQMGGLRIGAFVVDLSRNGVLAAKNGVVELLLSQSFWSSL